MTAERADTLRVAFPLLSVLHHGGVRVIIGLANHLARVGHCVDLLSPADRFKPLYPIEGAVNLKKLPAVGQGYPMSHLAALGLLAAHLLVRRYDLVVANFFPTSFASFIPTLVGRRALYLVQDYEPNFFPPYTFERLAARLTYRLRMPRVTFSGWVERSARVPMARLRLGLPEAFFETPRNHARRGMRVLCFPRTQPHKGLGTLIAALKMLSRRFEGLEVVAVTAEAEALTAMERADLRFAAERPSSDAELIALYDGAGLFVNASLVEGFSLPCLEAMSRGCPVVMTASGGVSEYASDGANALVVTPGEPSRLADAMARLLTDEPLVARLVAGGLATARAFRFSETAARFERICVEFCAETPQLHGRYVEILPQRGAAFSR